MSGKVNRKESVQNIKLKQPALLFFIIPFVIIGIMLILTGVRDYKTSLETKKWPNAQGKIIESSMEVSDSGSDRPGALYEPLVKFEYIVDDKTYIGTKIYYVNYNFSQSASAKKLVDSYPVKSKVRVYYEKNNPNQSILRPGINDGNYFLLIVGVFFIIAPTTLIYKSNIKKRR